jgi:hypothetical protein
MDHFTCGMCNAKCHGRRYIACDSCNQLWESHKIELFVPEKDFPVLRMFSLCLLSNIKTVQLRRWITTFVCSYQSTFDEAACLERIFLRYESRVVVSSDHANHNNLFRDHVAHQLLGSNWSGDTPIAVNTNGNCLFRALAVDLYEHQKASSEIRLKSDWRLVWKW